jgi:hypothetical protein
MKCENDQMYVIRDGVTTDQTAPACSREATHVTTVPADGEEYLPDDHKENFLCAQHARGYVMASRQASMVASVERL